MADSIEINLNSNSRSIIKIGFLIRAGFVLLMVLGTALAGIHFLKDSVLGASLCFALSFALFLAFYKIMNAAFFSEHLKVNKKDITVIQKKMSGTNTFVFDLDKIKYFGYAHQHYTKHPLDNKIVDFTGLGVQERELQYVIDDGNIQIETDTQKIKFGKNMPSWDVEELVEKIENFTGRKFIKPYSENVTEALFTESDEEIDPESEIIHETQIAPDVDIEVGLEGRERHNYRCDEGELVIAQKGEFPASEDIAYLNGKLAPTGKYKVGEKQFVLVSNGLIYAVRGFSEQ